MNSLYIYTIDYETEQIAFDDIHLKNKLVFRRHYVWSGFRFRKRAGRGERPDLFSRMPRNKLKPEYTLIEAHISLYELI